MMKKVEGRSGSGNSNFLTYSKREPAILSYCEDTESYFEARVEGEWSEEEKSHSIFLFSYRRFYSYFIAKDTLEGQRISAVARALQSKLELRFHFLSFSFLAKTDRSSSSSTASRCMLVESGFLRGVKKRTTDCEFAKLICCAKSYLLSILSFSFSL